MSLIVDIEKKLGDFNLKVKFDTNTKKIALYGLSGSGKTVTLKCISGIITPDKGKIVINGVTVFDKEKKINLPPQKRHVGYLPQHFSLFPDMTVEQNIMTGIKNRKDRKRICDKYIQDFSLEGVRKLYPHEISGGQAQRVALARALATNPSILLLDEPFSSLDSQLKNQMEYNLFNSLKDFSGDILLVTHDMHEVFRNCEEVCIIDNAVCNCGKAVKEVFLTPKTYTEAVLVGIDNIFEFENSEYNYIAFKSNDLCFNTEDNDVIFSGVISDLKFDIDSLIYYINTAVFDKPILVKVDKHLNDKKIGDSVSISVKREKIYYLK